jgi:hypothetical protein
MVRVECVATQGFLMFISMPLLTELGSIKDGFSYKHGAPTELSQRYSGPVKRKSRPRNGSADQRPQPGQSEGEQQTYLCLTPDRVLACSQSCRARCDWSIRGRSTTGCIVGTGGRIFS